MSICQILTLVSMLSGASLGQTMPVPIKLQGVLFKKIFFYDETLKAKGASKVTVLVTYTGGAPDSVYEVVKAFHGVGVNAAPVDSTKLAQAVTEESVIYLVPGADVALVKQICAGKSVLSITGVPESVEKGDVAIGVGVRADGRSQIIVNLGRVKVEGHELNSRLLGLAKVIK